MNNITTTVRLNCTQYYNGTFPPSPYEYPIWWFKDYNVGGPLVFGSAVLCAILSVAMLIFFFIRLHREYAQSKTRAAASPLVLSSLCMLSHVGYNIADAIMWYYWAIDYYFPSYHHAMVQWRIWWCCAKVFMYALFALRYHLLSQASMAYNSAQRKRFTIFGLLIVGMCLQIAFTVIYTVNYWKYISNWDDHDAKHLAYTSQWILLGIDLVLISFMGYLIVRTILDLVVSISRTKARVFSLSLSSRTRSGSGSGSARNGKRAHGSDSKEMELIDVSTRIALVCVVSLISSFLVQLLSLICYELALWHTPLTFVAFLYFFDNNINMICVYFSMSFGKAHYKKVCGDCCGCHKCCLSCIMAIVHQRVDIKQRKEEASQQKSNDSKIGQYPLEMTQCEVQTSNKQSEV